MLPDINKIECLLGALRDVIYSVDVLTKEFSYLSPAFERLLGYSIREIAEMGGREAFLKQVMEEGVFSQQNEILEELARGKSTKRNRHVAWWRCKDGSRICIEDNWSAVYEGGRLISTDGVLRDVTEQKKLEKEMEKMHKELLLVSRQAGMAEIATGVLHNVGNVLNSLNVSTALVIEGLAKSKISSVARLSALLEQNSGNLAAFFACDAPGSKVPAYVKELAEALQNERDLLLKECELIRTNTEHIKEIVAMQQTYSKAFSIIEDVKVVELIENALRLNANALERHGVEMVRDFQDPDRQIRAERHAVLQILINLIRNSKQACDDSGRNDKLLTVRSRFLQERVQIEVEDNGIGIPAENLTRIFNHGFTTRKQGHGFGLHSAALTAKQLGGNLAARSNGLHTGATFTLELPVSPPK